MNNDKSDYRRGLIYFSCLISCICLFFTTPDGDTVFYKLLGLFGINPGIKLGANTTLYAYMLIPLILAILSIGKVLKYWQGYGLRFKEYSLLLRYIPLFIAISTFLVSSNIVSPSCIDRIYYALISQQNGLQSITYYNADNNNLSYEFTGDIRTYSYDLTFENHGSEAAEFNVKLTTNIVDGFQEVFIKDDDGEKKVFALLPKQKMSYIGEFTEYYQTAYNSGKGKGVFSVVLVNDNEQYSPKPIVR